MILGLVALLVSPVLIFLTVRVLVQIFFPLADQSALNVLSTNPLQVALDLRWYLLAAVLIAMLAMSLAVWQTLRNSTLGRSSRSGAMGQRPLWQRFYVDLVLALLGCLVYGFYSYLLWTGSINAQLQVLLAGPCMLVAATLLSLAGILLFLRLFPLLLQWGTALAARRRGVVPLLALVVMARSPRQALRTALLLIFTIAFALFALVFTATQTQREYDLVNYRAGADFSGEVQQVGSLSPAQTLAAYQHIPGVRSAAVGSLYYQSFLHAHYGFQVMAVNTENFANAVTWSQEEPGQDEQHIRQMLAHLLSQRSVFVSATHAPEVPLPAIVDTATKNLLHLTVGKTFTLVGAHANMQMVDAGEVNHLPATNDLAPLDLELSSHGSADVLVDYPSYVSDYNKTINDPNANLAINYVWLHTGQDSASLAAVRHTIAHGPLKLSNFNDAQAMLASLQHDPLYLNLMCALALGVALALLLALLGNVTASWLYVRNRLRSLAVLRALGTTPAQLATLLGWEQAIVYLVAIVLGVLFGVFFTAMTLSSLVFSQLSTTGTLSNPYADNIFALQSVPALRIVIPPSLLIALGVLIALCILALAITTYTVSRPSLSQTLRLSEDYVEDAPLFVARTKDQESSAAPVASQARSQRARAENEARGGGERPQLVGTNSIARALSPLRNSWGYLLLTVLGIVVSIVMVCLVPLFSQVAATAGLRDILARPENRYSNVTLYFRADPPLSSLPGLIRQNTQDLNKTFLNQLGRYYSEQPVITMGSASIYPVDANNTAQPTSSSPLSLDLHALPAQNMAGHVQMVQGHLPGSGSDPLQIILTPDAASYVGAKVGDVLPPQAGIPFPVQLVGLFRPLTTSDPFLPSTFFTVPDPTKYQAIGGALVTSEGFMAAAQAFERTQPPNSYTFNGSLAWFYPINSERLDSTQLNDLTTTLTAMASDGFTASTGSTVEQVTLPTFALNQYQSSIQVASIPIVTTSVLIIGLILLFLGFMVELLVDREANAIAILRSRGATHRQIFTSFFTRAVLLNGLGLLIGLLLVIPAVSLLTRLTLLPADQRALNIVTDNPAHTLLGLSGYMLGTIVVTLLAMSFALYRATGADYLSQRREAARSTRRPLWQRFYLDLVGIVIALIAYGFSLYLTNAGILDPQVNVQVKSPLVLTATICLVLACSLLFLRLFPLLLRLGTMLATRNRNVAPMLALAQMARSPLQSMRVALLLLFTTAFVIFVSIFTASQSQHITDVAGYWTGADFSGSLASPRGASQLAAFQRLRGVKAATTGYVTSVYSQQEDTGLKLIAADPAAFMHVVIWPEVSSPQQQSSLIEALSSQRAKLQATLPHADPSPAADEPDTALPAIVDAKTWNTLQLTPGKRFLLRSGLGELMFIAVGKAAHIPTINDRAQTFSYNADMSAGMLVDYQSYAAVYSYLRERRIQEPSGGFGGDQRVPPPLTANYVWLSTDSDASTLAHVRQALGSSPLQLSFMYDRRATVQALNTDPLNLNLVGILILGALAPLVLTWIACLIASWTSARQRHTLFGILRALGSTPRQLTRVLFWEQAIVYGTAIVLGTLFGLLAALMALPSLVLTSIIPGIYTPTTSGRFSSGADPTNTLDIFSLQNTPQAHAIISPSLALVVGLLALLGLLAVLVMNRSLSRVVLAQALRLNED